MKTIQVEKASYIEDYKVEIQFSDRTLQIVDFGKFILKNLHPTIDKYRDIKKFQDFKIESGNLVWGKNWDLIFPVSQLYKGKIKA
jgi:hypothetical protein